MPLQELQALRRCQRQHPANESQVHAIVAIVRLRLGIPIRRRSQACALICGCHVSKNTPIPERDAYPVRYSKWKASCREMTPVSDWTNRLVVGRYPDRKFDIEFWQKQGDEAIFQAAWEMIEVAEEMKHGRKPELQSTVTAFKRLPGKVTSPR